jgi:multiple sugar transport system permease protein
MMERELYLDPKEVKIFKIKRIASQSLIYAFLILMGLFIIIPFYWMLISSVKQTWEITSPNITLLPVGLNGKMLMPWNWAWDNYGSLINGLTNAEGVEIFKPMPLGWMFLNTIVVGLLTTIGTVITTILASFAFARLNFKGRELIFSILLMTMMIPGEIYVITNYQTIGSLGWRNTYQALVLPFVTSVFYTFFLRQTFKQIPNELYLAAKVDGTSDFGYLIKIMIPIARATIITIIILSMIGTWNAYVWPSLVTNDKSMYLVSNGLLEMFKGKVEQSGPDSILNVQMAGSTMVTVPLLIVFILLRKYIMSGVSRSGIKG